MDFKVTLPEFILILRYFMDLSVEGQERFIKILEKEWLSSV